MDCEECGEHKPTWFTIFGRGQGFFVVSSLDVEFSHLCQRCVKSRYTSFTGSTICFGWFSVPSALHALRYVPGNVLEYRRVRRTLGLSPEATPDQLAESAEMTVRRIVAHHAEWGFVFGGLAAAFGTGCLVALATEPAAREFSGVFATLGGLGLLTGAVLIGRGVMKRNEALHGDFDTVRARVE